MNKRDRERERKKKGGDIAKEESKSLEKERQS